jgi:hypothetical protein
VMISKDAVRDRNPACRLGLSPSQHQIQFCSEKTPVFLSGKSWNYDAVTAGNVLIPQILNGSA